LWYAGGKMDWGNVIGSNRGVDEVDKGSSTKSRKRKLPPVVVSDQQGSF